MKIFDYYKEWEQLIIVFKIKLNKSCVFRFYLTKIKTQPMIILDSLLSKPFCQ